MNPNGIMTWAGPLLPDPIEAWNPDRETMTLAGPLDQAEEEPIVRVTASASETVLWAGPLPPDGWEPPRRRARFSAIAEARSARAQAKA